MLNNKILVIDDEPDFIDAVRARLEPNGYAVIAAHNGRDGLERARKELPGLILLDLVMPRSNGFEALSWLKTEPATLHIPVIVISAKNEPEYVLDAGKFGAADYIMKPVSMQTLLDYVKKYL